MKTIKNVVVYSHPLEDLSAEEAAHDDGAADDEEPGHKGLRWAAILTTLTCTSSTSSTHHQPTINQLNPTINQLNQS